VSGTGHFCFEPKIHTKENTQIWQKSDVQSDLSFSMLSHYPNGIPKMLATLQMVILLFSKTTFFPQSTIASVLLISGSPKQLAYLADVSYHFGTWKITQKTCVLSTVSSPKASSHILKFLQHFFPV